MRPGSRLVIFTDGLSDAQNTAGEEFGEQRLVDYCKTIPAAIDAKGAADAVMQAVAEWSVGTEQFDDTTVVVLDITPLSNTEAQFTRAAEAKSRPLLDTCVTLPS